MLGPVRAAGLTPLRRLTALARGEAKWQVVCAACGGKAEPFEEEELWLDGQRPCKGFLKDQKGHATLRVVRDHQGLWTKAWDGVCAEMGAFQKPELKNVSQRSSFTLGDL